MVFFLVYRKAVSATERKVKRYVLADGTSVTAPSATDSGGDEDQGGGGVNVLFKNKAMPVKQIECHRGWFLASVGCKMDELETRWGMDRPVRKEETLAETLARMKDGETLKESYNRRCASSAAAAGRSKGRSKDRPRGRSVSPTPSRTGRSRRHSFEDDEGAESDGEISTSSFARISQRKHRGNRNSGMDDTQRSQSRSYRSCCDDELDVSSDHGICMMKAQEDKVQKQIESRTEGFQQQRRRSCMRVEEEKSSSSSKKSKPRRRVRHVDFKSVLIREYGQCLGDNPACSSGPPISLSWTYRRHTKEMSLDDYEWRRFDRRRKNFSLSAQTREQILRSLGYTYQDLVMARRRLKRDQLLREQTIYNLRIMRMEETMESFKRLPGRMGCRRRSAMY